MCWICLNIIKVCIKIKCEFLSMHEWAMHCTNQGSACLGLPNTTDFGTIHYVYTTVLGIVAVCSNTSACDNFKEAELAKRDFLSTYNILLLTQWVFYGTLHHNIVRTCTFSC